MRFWTTFILITICFIANCQYDTKSSSKYVTHDDEQLFLNRISNVRYQNDSLFFSLIKRSSCGVSLKFKSIISSDTLYLFSRNESKITEFCWCLFEYKLEMKSKENQVKTLMLDGVNIPLTEKIYIDFPPKEIDKKLVNNKTDNLGNKIGYWKLKKNGNTYLIFYGDGKLKENQFLWLKAYRKKRLQNVQIRNVQIDEVFLFTPERYFNLLETIKNE